MIIDVHTIFGKWPKRQIDISLERLLADMKRLGIDKAVSLSAAGIYQPHDEANRKALAAASEHPEIIPACTFNMNMFYDGADEVDRCLEQGFKVVRVFPDYQGWSYRSFTFRHLVELLADKGLPLMAPALGGASVAELTEAAGGKGFPVILGEVKYANISEVILAAKKCDDILIDIHAVQPPDTLKILAREVSVERLILGTNMPLYSPSVRLLLVEHSGLSAAHQEKILGGNLMRLLGL